MLGMPMPSTKNYNISPFLIEFLGGFLLMWVYTLVIEEGVKQTEWQKGVKFGLAYFVLRATVGDISGGCFDPAMIFGPCLISWKIGEV